MDKNVEITIPAHDSKHVNVASLLGTLRYHLRRRRFWGMLGYSYRENKNWMVVSIRREWKPLEFNGYRYATNLKKESFSGNGK